ncbi:hypothetical protein ACVRW7_05655 [Streptococcus ratti]|uniref:Uncharacterized protein n=1 Tax=Streptococcus ratti FA-1 = DSM 20564 TaxID=699248 RepID=A0ABP2QVW9_STRRT|nr:hypothetical protein [Streptococcus ratti]EJN93180.1 hypothetical protein SRA_09833 [Streptococcus ratti FA-1 = DSM 20564]EMP70095.1 hypothetical protein D822_05477 [Streptococcus ratti FA-1 = DSM 20564]QEY06851.1 hypothetical protein FY406_03910 [Streptococcus ratti]VEI59265.1 Uncharacterised protein [Streptococcus mutans]
MIGLNFVFEKDELLYSLKLSTQMDKKYSLDYFDFDNQNFEDFIDYLEFLEFDKYVFVTLDGNSRLKRLVNYLKDQLDMEIAVIDVENLDSLLEDSKIQEIKAELKNHDLYHKLSSLKTEQVFQNGFQAFKTATYPNLAKGLLKHAFVDDLGTFILENRNLLNHFAINSAVYTNDNDKAVKEQSPIIIKSVSDFANLNFKILDRKSLGELFNQFVNSGRISLTDYITDYGVLTGTAKLNSLYFVKGQFYLDSQEKIRLGNSGDNYQQLHNQASLQLSENNNLVIQENVKYLLTVLLDITYVYGEMDFITPYNNYQIKAVDLPFNQLKWIAFKNDNSHFAFNVKTGRLFKINALVTQYLEYIIKSKDSHIDNEAMSQVKEMLQVYG